MPRRRSSAAKGEGVTRGPKSGPGQYATATEHVPVTASTSTVSVRVGSAIARLTMTPTTHGSTNRRQAIVRPDRGA